MKHVNGAVFSPSRSLLRFVLFLLAAGLTGAHAGAARVAQARTDQARRRTDDLIVNADLQQRDARGWPRRMETFKTGGDYRFSLTENGPRPGAAALRIDGRADGGRACVGQTTPPVPAAAAYRLRFYYRGSGGRKNGFFRFRVAPGDEPTFHFQLQSDRSDWTLFERVFVTHPEIRPGAAVRIEVKLYQRGKGFAEYALLSVKPLRKDQIPPPVVSERPPAPLMIPTRPEDGAIVTMNPPDMTWTPQSEAVQYRLELAPDRRFPPSSTIRVDLSRHYYRHHSVLEPGVWYWRFRFETRDGRRSGWSRVRRFLVQKDAAACPLPPVDELMQRRRPHPRTFDRAACRARLLQGEGLHAWRRFLAGVDAALGKPPRPEPEKKDFPDTPEGRAQRAAYTMGPVNRATMTNTHRMLNAAFAYFVTGARKYAQDAARIAAFLAGWDLNGATGYRYQDQSFRDIAWKLAVTWDLAGDAMTPQQRRRVLAAIRDRTRVLYRDFALDAHPIDQWPFDSHGMTSLGFLAIIAACALGDIPEAEDWFRFVVPAYLILFPPWGGEDGGWSQGVNYWKWSCTSAMQALDILRNAVGAPAYEKSWCRNNGWFKLYFHPPFCPRAHFGDDNLGRPGGSDKLNMAHWAGLYRNPYFQWYQQQIHETLAPTAPWRLLWPDPGVQPKPPADIPLGRWNRDVGWVAMHSDLCDPEEIYLLFKSSWYGSFNHSHADQNHFVLYAFGEPLIIDAGYYDYYGSPHHYGFTVTTRAHNALLIDGRGQRSRDITARGRILDWFDGPGFSWTVGDAAQAYSPPPERMTRTVLFAARRFFVIADAVDVAKPVQVQWLLHSLSEPLLPPENAGGMLRIARGKARLACDVRAAGTELTWRKTDRFPSPPVWRRANAPKQWHVTAETRSPQRRVRIASVLVPFREGTPEPRIDVQPLASGGWGGVVREGDLETTVVLREDAPGGAKNRGDFANLATDGTAGVVARGRRDGSWTMLFLKRGRVLDFGGTVLYRASAPVTCSVRRFPGEMRATAEAPAAVRLAIACEDRVRAVTVNGSGTPVQRSPDGGAVVLQLSAGRSTVRLQLEGAPPAPRQVKVLDGRGRPLGVLEPLQGTNGRNVFFGRVRGGADALVRLRFETRGPAAGLWVQTALTGKIFPIVAESAKILELSDVPLSRNGAGTWLMASCPPGTRLEAVRIEPETIRVRWRVHPLPQKEAEGLVRRPGGVRVEAEAFSTQSRGRARVYRHRKFLSGGAGLHVTEPGNRVSWRVSVSRPGRYDVFFCYATHERDSVRRLLIDERPVGGAGAVVLFPAGPGYGATPSEWRVGRVCDGRGSPLELEFTAGEHTITLVNVHGMVNLDWLALCPASQGEE